MLICMYKITSSLTSFLGYCKETTNLSFWVIWACLTTYTQNDSINLKKTLMFICRQKNQLNLSCFLWDNAKILQTCYFRYFGHARLWTSKWYYELVENFCVYLQAKHQLHSPCFSWDNAKICKLILDPLDITGYAQQKW